MDATEKVIAASAALFGNGDLTVLYGATLKAATSDPPFATIDAGALESSNCWSLPACRRANPPHAAPWGRVAPT